MTNLWDYFKNFFREAEQSSASRPIFSEALTRSPEMRVKYEDWKRSIYSVKVISWLKEQYALSQSRSSYLDRNFTFLDTPSTKGFAVHFPTDKLDHDGASHLLDLLKDRVQQLNYRLQHADIRTWAEKDWAKTVQRYYLKPRQTWAEGQKIDQRYGNITIELNLRNDTPYLLTFRSTSYADRLYAEPADFHELMQALLA